MNCFVFRFLIYFIRKKEFFLVAQRHQLFKEPFWENPNPNPLGKHQISKLEIADVRLKNASKSLALQEQIKMLLLLSEYYPRHREVERGN